MAQTVNITLSTDDRERLAAIIGDRNRPQKHVRRTMIILLSGDRLPVLEVARQAGVSRPAVWRWQQRFAEEGVDGLLRDKTRKPGKAPLPAEIVARVLALPCTEPPGEATHWTGRAGAKGVGNSWAAVQRTGAPGAAQAGQAGQATGNPSATTAGSATGSAASTAEGSGPVARPLTVDGEQVWSGRTVSGVPVGWDHSEAGAVGAASRERARDASVGGSRRPSTHSRAAKVA